MECPNHYKCRTWNPVLGYHMTVREITGNKPVSFNPARKYKKENQGPKEEMELPDFLKYI